MTIDNQIYLKRHGVYEKRFAKSFYLILLLAHRQIAKNLLEGRPIDQIDIQPLANTYQRMYQDIMRKEGVFIWNTLVVPTGAEEIKQKDIFDQVAQILQPENSAELLTLWTNLMNGFLTYYIGQRILEVMNTTINRANEMITQGRAEGLTNQEIARKIQADRRARELRANTIARTEATTAINKSWMLALQSSGKRWEKSWHAIRDDRTRDAHWETDPQFWIPVDASFDIRGFSMGYPGDNTQGAPLNLLINCRCHLKFRPVGARAGFRLPTQNNNTP